MSTNAEASTSLKLENAARLAARLRGRVSGTIAWSGWSLLVLGLTPWLLHDIADVNIDPTIDQRPI